MAQCCSRCDAFPQKSSIADRDAPCQTRRTSYHYSLYCLHPYVTVPASPKTPCCARIKTPPDDLFAAYTWAVLEGFPLVGLDPDHETDTSCWLAFVEYAVRPH